MSEHFLLAILVGMVGLVLLGAWEFSYWWPILSHLSMAAVASWYGWKRGYRMGYSNE